MTIAIDGPIGSGKSTVAKALAKKLNIVYLDTGAMYRALAFDCLRNGIDPHDKPAVTEHSLKLRLSVEYIDGSQHIFVNGDDVSEQIRSEEVGLATSALATIGELRTAVVAMQQSIAENCSLVMDGRDIGTVVLPNADFKFYLDADVAIRAKRRYEQLLAKGQEASLDKVTADLLARDYNDMHREVSPLRRADDAVLVNTDNLSFDEVVEYLYNKIF